jgi:cytochrome c peroxidase
MKKMLLLPSLVLLIALFNFSLTERKKDLASAISRIEQRYIRKVGYLDSFLITYPRYFYDSSYPIRKSKYEQLCYNFKQTSGFLFYFEPDLFTNRLVGPFQFHKNDKKGFFNGIPDGWLFQGPIGNEPDSTLLKEYSKDDSLSSREFIISATSAYRDVLRKSQYRQHLLGMSDTVLFDALRKDIFRISTIDLANSDFIVDEAASASLKGSLDSWLAFVGELVKELPADQYRLSQQWDSLSRGAAQMVAANADYRTLDRMLFTKKYLIPLCRIFSEMQRVFDIPLLKKSGAIRSDAEYIYEKNIFNIDYFAEDSNAYYSADKAALGELLFFDPILSDNNQRACASCHKPEMAFTDGKTKSVSFQFAQLPRNSPTVINSGFQKKLFWDMRAGSLEAQLDSVVNNANELHSSFHTVIEKINASPEYLAAFHKAFPATKKQGITREYVKYAIAVYERTLSGLNSRFDQYMQGDDSKLTNEEIRGFNVYMGKAKCGVCHFAPLFNGSMPPFFDISDHHAIGVPIKDTMVKYVVDPDPGLMKINGEGFDKFSVKVPTLRNIALTTPYMHNGVFSTLEQVVDFYDKAAGNQFTKDMRPDMAGLPFFTILPIPLNLSAAEKTDLISFLKTLTDTSASAKVPKHLPSLKPPYAQLNGRTIGGDY